MLPGVHRSAGNGYYDEMFKAFGALYKQVAHIRLDKWVPSTMNNVLIYLLRVYILMVNDEKRRLRHEVDNAENSRRINLQQEHEMKKNVNT